MTEASIRVVFAQRVNELWPEVEPFISAALAKGHGEIDAAQVRLLLAQGRAELVIQVSEERVHGAMVVEFHDYPNVRVAHIVAIAGNGLVKERDAWDQIKAWLRAERGCQEIRGFASEAVARLWRRVGFDEIYRVVRTKL